MISHMYYCTVYISSVVPSDPVNIMISNVTDVDDITVFIDWDPPTDPNGVIRYYRVQFMEVLDPLDGSRRKRNIPLNVTVMNEFVNITSGSAGAPTSITLRGLG